MTTRKELQAWLDQFPEDAEIEVITTHEDSRGYESYTSVYETDMILQDLPEDFISWFESATFEVEKYLGKTVVRLGRKD